ncbi:MAG: hypothetical protein NT026_02115 [Candidatus Staskawiczbacteria bacterium]|nr:hypothetical protein [Candidatus Staskawiczbacteria bacterium]
MMKTIYKILIFGIVLFLLLAFIFSFASKVSSQNLKITGIKSEYGYNEDVVVSGTAKKNCEIIIFYNQQMGSTSADSSGRWVVNLGKLPPGEYAFQVLANDSAISESTTTARIIVASGPKTTSLLNNFLNFFTAGLSSPFQKTPDKLTTVPETAPEALKGNWRLIR